MLSTDSRFVQTKPFALIFTPLYHTDKSHKGFVLLENKFKFNM